MLDMIVSALSVDSC